MPDFNLLLLLTVPVVIAAGFFHGALGLGFPMIATPIIAVLVDVKAAIIITLLPTATVNVASVLSAKNPAAALRKYQPMLIAAFFGAIVGSWMLAVTEPSPYRLALALLIICFLLTSHFNLRLSITPGTAMMFLFGGLAGLAGGTTNVMVAVLIIYFLSARVERAEMVPAMNLCFLTGKLTQTVVFIGLGVVSLPMLFYTAPLAVVSYIALRVGQSYADKINAERYRDILRVILLLLALILIVQFVREI